MLANNGFSCNITGISILTPQDAIIENIINKPQSCENFFCHLSILYFNGGSVHYFPRQLSNFGGVSRLTFENCGLKEIHKDDFKGIYVQHLRITGSDIEIFEHGLFDYTKLETLIILSHKIIFINPSAFRNANTITFFSLSKTNCVDEFSTADISEIQDIWDLIRTRCSNQTCPRSCLTYQTQINNHSIKINQLIQQLSSLQTIINELKTDSCHKKSSKSHSKPKKSGSKSVRKNKK